MNILIIQTAFIGDVVLSTPLVEKVKDAYPEGKITYVTTPVGASILRNNPHLEEIIEYDKRGEHKGIKGLLVLGKRLKYKNFDLVICPHRYLRSSILAWLTGCNTRLGYDNAAGKFLFTDKIHYDKDKHEVEKLLSFVRGNEEKRYEVKLYPGKKELIYSYSIVLAKEALEEIQSTTAYTYKYLGEEYEKEVNIVLEGLEKLLVEEQKEKNINTTNTILSNQSLNQSIKDTNKASHQDVVFNALPFLIGSLIAFIIILFLFIWRFVGKKLMLNRQHKHMLAKYQDLLGNAEIIKKRRIDLQKEQEEVKKKLSSLQEHLAKYEEKLPTRINKLDHKEDDLDTIEHNIEEKQSKLLEQMLRFDFLIG